MTKRLYIILAASLLVVVFITVYLSQAKKNSTNNNILPVESATFKVAGGWGYNIFVDQKIFIHQEEIPAIGGNKVFIKKEDAENTAALIVQKISNKKVPSVSKGELDSMRVKY